VNKNGPIILIDDDEDDLQLLIEVFADLNLPNEIHLFKNTATVIAFLQKQETDPFLVISDINMPVMNGFQLRDVLNSDREISRKNIPYLFFTTASSMKVVSSNAEVRFQGIFRKPVKPAEWRETLNTIVRYWALSLSPGEFEL